MKMPGNQRLVTLRSLLISRVEAQTLVPACGADPLQCPDGGRPTAMWTYKLLSTKHFHRVSSESPYLYLLQAGYG